MCAEGLVLGGGRRAKGCGWPVGAERPSLTGPVSPVQWLRGAGSCPGLLYPGESAVQLPVGLVCTVHEGCERNQTTDHVLHRTAALIC